VKCAQAAAYGTKGSKQQAGKPGSGKQRDGKQQEASAQRKRKAAAAAAPAPLGRDVLGQDALSALKKRMKVG